ncbi:hypothetical protein NE237_031019 [Protea cynaroides]|uniref:Late embryogenesis abundant protein LEA-2 subgroup domain-containing protein n=1 Tax=Protea cynaroides TaxID=273540 RepID=A0A9Q0GU26_9MAGN|nr:hypothetical protein NE237_031019 [Protea cynaroides]
MAEETKPVLQKPPGYKDPNVPIPSAPKPQIRKQPLPVSFQPRRKRRGFCRFCLCFLCVFLLLLIFLIAAAGAVFYLWFHPKLPIYRLQSIQFARFNVSVTADGTYLDSQTVVRFEVENPNQNKITFYYGQNEVGMTVDDDVDLGSASIPGFSQAKRNITVLKFTIQVKHELINDAEGPKLKAQFGSKIMAVNVGIRTRFGVGLAKWKLGKVPTNVLCRNVKLKQLNGVTTPQCTIKLLRWINLG